jgi:hypothetical protein
MPLCLEFKRSFQVWLYTVSHAQLLLRSNRTSSIETRIDILFKDVGEIHLPTKINDLVITQILEDSADYLELSIDKDVINRRLLYYLSGSHSSPSYVIAGSIHWHEDFGSYSDKSHFQSAFILQGER